MKPEKELVKKMKNAKSKEDALKILGGYFAARLNKFGEDYSDASGAFVGSFLATTELLMNGGIDTDAYNTVREASIEVYMDTIDAQRKKLKSEIKTLADNVLAQLSSLKKLPDIEKKENPVYA